MKSKMINNNVFWFLCGSAGLTIGFILCRYVYFDLHGMKDWPLVLWIFGMISLTVAAFSSAKIVLMAIPAGYGAGFVLAMRLRTYGIDPGGGRTSNAWIIWTISFAGIIGMGIIGELIAKHRLDAMKKR